MKTTHSLKYGRETIDFELPGNAEPLNIREPAFSIDRQSFVKNLVSLVSGKINSESDVSIVVADKTRLCGYIEYLPWVTKALMAENIGRDRITFFIAYGTHARQREKECLQAYGDTYKHFRFIHHDCRDENLFAALGKTQRGTTVRVRKDILQSDLIITFGALSHHYFAGFGGGRKLLFPGLGFEADIYQNHSLFLDKKLENLAAGCRPGKLDGNPLAEDLKEVNSFITPKQVSIHGILDSTGRVCRLVTGTAYQDFLNACSVLDAHYRFSGQKTGSGGDSLKTVRKYDLVIASAGGFPKDINFIQAHKAVNNAAMFVKDGGTFLILAECRDGLGSQAFLEYFDHKNFKTAFTAISKNYKGNGGTALSMMSKTSRIRILIKTDLDQGICRKLGMQAADISDIKNRIKEHSGSIAVIDNASLLIP